MLSFKCCSASLSMLLAFGNPKYLTCWFAINRNPYTISFSIHETSLLLLQIPCRPKTYRGRYKFTFPPFLWILFDNAWAGTGNDIPKDPWAILELPAKLVDKWRAKVTPLSRCTLQFQMFQVQMAFCNSIVYPQTKLWGTKQVWSAVFPHITSYLMNPDWVNKNRREKNQFNRLTRYE
jgi:hypothetical protein